MIRKFRIGVDLDNVAADSDAAWSSFLAVKHEDDVQKIGWRAKTWDHWNRICESCFEEAIHSEDMVRKLPVMRHAFRALAELKNAGHELIALTARPESTFDATAQWVYDRGMAPLFKDLVFDGDKASYATEHRLDYHIDDSPKVIAQFQAEWCNTDLIIFDRLYNRRFENAGIRLYGWNEILAYIKAQDVLVNLERAS